MTHVSELEGASKTLTKSDPDNKDTVKADAEHNIIHIDKNVDHTAGLKVQEHDITLDNLDNSHIGKNTNSYIDDITHKPYDTNIIASSKEHADLYHPSIALESSDLQEPTQIDQDKSFDSSVGPKGQIVQDPPHIIEHFPKGAIPYTSDDKAQGTVLMKSPQKEQIDEEILYHTPIIIEHTKDSSHDESVNVKNSDAPNLNMFDSTAHKTQNIQEKSHNLDETNTNILPPTSFTKKHDTDISIEHKSHDVHDTGSVLSVSHKRQTTEQDPYSTIQDTASFDPHKHTEPNIPPFNTVEPRQDNTTAYSVERAVPSRDPRLQTPAERKHIQEMTSYRTSIEYKTHEIQDPRLNKQDVHTQKDKLPSIGPTVHSTQDRPHYTVEQQTFDAKDTSSNKQDTKSIQGAESKTIAHTEHISKDPSSFYTSVEHKIDRKDITTHHGHKKLDTIDTIPFKTPIGHEQDTYHVGHKMHERDTTYHHKEHDIPNPMSYKGPIGHDTSTYTPIGHKKHYEDTNPYNAPFGYMGHKDISYPSSHKPNTDSTSYPGLEQKQEHDAGYIKGQIEQYPDIHHATEQKKSKNTTPYTVGHAGLLQQDPYHAPIAYDPNTSYPPMGQPGPIEHDPNYPMGHTRPIEHDPYSYGHMGHVDTLYNPFDHYAFEHDAFGYMGHLGETKHAEQARDTSVPYDVGHMDAFQAMEQSRHVLEADTETRPDTQGHETSPTHMLL